MGRTKAVRTKNNKHLYLILAAGAFTSGAKLPEAKSVSIAWPTETIDASNYDEGTLKAKLMGDQDFSLSYAGNFVPDNALLRDLVDAKAAGDSVFALVVFGDAPDAGAKNIAFMQEMGITELNFGDGDVIEVNMDLEALEEPTITHDIIALPTYT